MTKEEMINKIVQGHIRDITNWVMRGGELDFGAWLTMMLGLKKLSREQLQTQFRSYVEGE